MYSPFTWLLISAAVLLSACSDPSAETIGKRHGGVFNLNETTPLSTLFPPNIRQYADWRLAGLVYEGLVRMDTVGLGVAPGIAERWEISPDGRVYTFYLRGGVRFHDAPLFEGGQGRALDARDVVGCFTRLCSPSDENRAFWLFKDRVKGASEYYNAKLEGRTPEGGVAGLEVVDDHTVRITLKGPCAPFLRMLTHPGCWIYPEEVRGGWNDAGLVQAVGTGPFRLRHVEPGVAMVFERWCGYWARDAEGMRLPYLDGVRVTFEADEDKEWAAFRNGVLTLLDKVQPHMAHQMADSLDLRTGEPRFKVGRMPLLSVHYYGFNLEMEPFDDPRVRMAFAKAIDRDRIVEGLLKGMAEPADHGLVPPGLLGYPYNAVHNITYDPDSARSLLAEAGFPGGKGFPKVVLQVNNDGYGYVAVAEAVQEQLAEELGVGITISVLPAPRHLERVYAGRAAMWRAGWAAEYPDPESFLSLLDSRNIRTTGGLAGETGVNTTRYADRRFDELVDASRHGKGEEERLELLARAEALALESVPLLPLYYRHATWMARPEVKGLHLTPMGVLDLRSVWLDLDADGAASTINAL